MKHQEVGCVYCVTNIINGQMYIGLTKNFKSRRAEHMRNAYANHNVPFHKALAKYGPAKFSWKILEDDIPLEDLPMYEMMYIDMFDTYNLGYNATMGGEGSHGVTVSEETRKKLSEAASGRVMPDEAKEKVRQANLGRKHTELTRLRMSEAHKGKRLSEEQKKKIGDAQRGEKSCWYGKKRSVEDRKKISEGHKGQSLSEANSGSNHYFYGKKLSEEHKHKISEAHKGKTTSVELIAKRSKPVYQCDMDFNIIREFTSAKEASIVLGIEVTSIGKACRGEIAYSHGYKWKFVPKLIKGGVDNDESRDCY